MFKKIKSFLFENKSDKQTIIKNTFWLIVAEGVSKGSIFILLILIARILGPKEFGILSFVMSFVSMFIVLTDFGLTTLMVREVSKDHGKTQEYLINLSFLKILLGILTFTIIRISSKFIGKNSIYIYLILIYSGYSIINNFGEFIRSFFRPSEKMQHEAFLKILNGLLQLFIIGYFLFFNKDLISISYGFLIAGIISLLISIIYVISKFKISSIKINKKIINNSIKSGLYLMGGMLVVNMFNYIDQIMIGFMRTETELGYYSASYKIVGILLTLCVLFANVIIPKMSKIIHDKPRLNNFIKDILKYFFPLVLVGYIFNILFSKQIISLVLGKEYISISNLYLILLLTVVPMFLNNIYGNILIILHKEKLYLISVIIGLLINIVLNYIFIPKYGALSASVATLLTESITFAFYFYFYFKQKKL